MAKKAEIKVEEVQEVKVEEVSTPEETTKVKVAEPLKKAPAKKQEQKKGPQVGDILYVENKEVKCGYVTLLLNQNVEIVEKLSEGYRVKFVVSGYDVCEGIINNL